MEKIYVSDVHRWQPSSGNPKEKPALEFADSLFKRRLSQITRMTIQVVHELLEKNPSAAECKQVFVSFRGEIGREFSIDKSLLEDSEILPASFTLSVFNAPIASASLCLGLKTGYSVIYPSKNNFNSAFLASISPVVAGSEEKILFVYADEYIPDEYGVSRQGNNNPMALACIVSRSEGGTEVNPMEIKSPCDLEKM